MGVRAIAEREDRPSLEDLVVGARAGDFAAFEGLYHLYVGRIYGLCFRMTASAPRAEELTQETFLNAWHGLRSFRGETGFPHWLRRVAINAVLTDRRSRRRREDREQPMGDVTQFRHPSLAAAGAAGVDLERAIAGLPAGARDVFVLHDVEGYRHAEIGDLLGIAEGTSKAQLHRARKLLREALRS